MGDAAPHLENELENAVTMRCDELGVSGKCTSRLGICSRLFNVERHVGLCLDRVRRDLELGVRFCRTFRAERRR
jgi:hypothetical protein